MRSRNSQLVLAVASHGGHWVQMRRLMSAFEGLPIHYVSTTAGVAHEVAPFPVSVVRDANLQDKVALVRLALETFWIVARTRPAYVLSTGAAPGFFALMFGKLFGARTIWVDSLANADCMSVSGAKVQPFADLWLTQWPELEISGGPLYRGAVL
ncbi:MAG: UDP-N-acetylglucosamine--LPS N-acetylglucosamine transferase [Oleiphilaceae bacterium]|nr:UDP-N-acetylglucosamine--LPS N-acetylglucosamine transferase [Oleiphilaceae bacterium]